jgi:hypothetical protein
MRLLSLFVTRNDGVDHDDIFNFDSLADLPDHVRVTAKFAGTGVDSGKGYNRTFVLSRSGVYDYVLSLVGSLVRDDDPYDRIQLSSAIYPSVIYRVEDLEDCTVRSSIQDIIYSSFNTTVQ